MREPVESMRYLILKPVGEDVTEEQIRKKFFKGYRIVSIRFEVDELKYEYYFFE